MSSRPSTCGAAARGDLERLARAHRRRAFRPGRAQRAAAASPWRASPSMWPPSFDAEPSTPIAHRHAGIAHRAHRRDARGQPHVRARAMRHAGAACARTGAMPASSSLTQCACHTSWPTQPRSSAYSAGVQPNVLARVGDVVVVLGQVRVQRHAVLARQQRRSRASGRGSPRTASTARPTMRRIAWRAASCQRSITRCVSFRIAASSLDHAVGRQAALRLAHAHRAARGMEAHADLARRLELSSSRTPFGIDVQVVAARRAAGQQQLGHRRLRATRAPSRASGGPRSGTASAASRTARSPAPAR